MGRQEQIATRNYFHFWIKIGDFGLNYCILNENAKTATSGSNASLPSLHIVSREVRPMAK